MKLSEVAKWEIRKHMAIELFPMSLKKQQEYMRRTKGKSLRKK